ncbi:MAG: glycosyltransferase family 4 protein [Candidatus Omnitrophota bacterium]
MAQPLHRNKAIKLGVVRSDSRRLSESVRRLSENVLRITREDFCTVEFNPDAYASKPRRLREYTRFAQEVGIILFLPRVDSSFIVPQETPLMFFGLGAMPRPHRHLFEYHKFLFPQNAILLSCSSDIKIFHELFPNFKEMAYFLPWPVDTELFTPVSAQVRLKARKALGVGTNEHLMLYAGRVCSEKNIHTLLKVFKGVTQRLRNVRLLIAGLDSNAGYDDFTNNIKDYSRYLKGLIGRYGLRGKVRTIPSVKKKRLPALYSAADVFVNCTLCPDENFGYAQVEAMACGTPVVCSCWGGLKDTVRDGFTGYHMPTTLTRKGPALNWRVGVTKIVSLLKNMPLRRELSENCRKQVENNYSFTRFSSQLAGIISDTIRRKDRNNCDSGKTLFRYSSPDMMSFYLEFIYTHMYKNHTTGGRPARGVYEGQAEILRRCAGKYIHCSG